LELTVQTLRVISSNPFEFVVGPDRKKFTIHTALAAYHSPILAVMMTGHMSEAQDGRATLEEIDEQTFVQFCEYAYTKDYTPTPYEIVLDSSMLDGGNALGNNYSEELLDSFPSPSNSSFLEWRMRKLNKRGQKMDTGSSYAIDKPCLYCGHKPGKQAFWNELGRTDYAISIQDFEARKNIKQCEDYTNVFLGHARIYVFADRYNVATLRTLALGKLYRTLDVFNIYSNRIGDIINLIRYSYSNSYTRDSDGVQDMDSLRKLVIHYIVYMFEDLAKDDHFLALMEEGGPFVRDLMVMLLGRIDG
jgi:hypothetical protein